MNKMLFLNHKMNLNYEDISAYIDDINSLNYEDIVIIPSSVYLKTFIDKSNYKIGIQNIYYEDKGAFTGEISSYQAKSLGVSYALIGHSERRTIFQETNSMINKKVISALQNNLKVVLCIGESLEEKEKNITNEVLDKELEEALKGTNSSDDIVVAYEPVWSIGTGLIPSKEELEATIEHIHKKLEEMNYKNIKILYGGSANETNSKEILNINYIDGLLIGGASLVPNKINLIINSLN